MLSLLLWPAPGYPTEFEGTFEEGRLLEDQWQIDTSGDCEIRIVDDPVREGRYSARFSSGTGARCELVVWVGSTILGRLKREPFRQDRWYAFSVYLPLGWTSNPRNEIVAQWHGSDDRFFGESGGRGPPLALRIEDDHWRITYGWDRDLISSPGAKAVHTLWQGPYRTGVWTDWVFHVRWSHEDDGLTEVWRNGMPITRREGPNAYNDLRGVYLKLGNYHPGQPRQLYLDEVRVGGPEASLDSISPKGPPTKQVPAGTPP